MTHRPVVIALHAIGAARASHGLVEEILRRVIAGGDRSGGHPVMGLVDVDFLRMDAARSKLSLLDPAEVGSVAGPAAAAALTGFLRAFDPIEDAYGRVAGPDRTREQADGVADAMASAAESALAHLMDYWREVGGLEIPSMDSFVEAMRERRIDRGPPPPAEPRSGVPRVRRALDGDVTAPRARILLGRAFGVVAGTYLRTGASDAGAAGAAACADLAGLSAHVGVRSDSLSRRMSAIDFDIRDELADGAKAVDALSEGFMDVLEGTGIEPEALADLRVRAVGCLKDVGTRIRRIERLSALRGYDLGPAPEPSAPTP